MKEAIQHSKNTFENILINWELTKIQKKEIQSNIDYLNEILSSYDHSKDI